MVQEGSPPSEADHQPVLVAEVLQALRPRPREVYLDVTVGLGGHALSVGRVLERGAIVGIDRDRQALAAAETRLRAALPATVDLHLRAAPFSDFPHVLDACGFPAVDMLLADLGVSSLQLDRPDRGMAHRFDAAALDMRMDTSRGRPLAERWGELADDELARVLRDYGEIVSARRVARALKAAAPQTVAALKTALGPFIHGDARGKLLARVFQALRIWINDELGELEALLAAVPTRLRAGGRIAILSYHSLEDRRVKTAFRAWERGCICPPTQPICTCGRPSLGRCGERRPVAAGDAETAANPRARSARLRSFVFSGAAA